MLSHELIVYTAMPVLLVVMHIFALQTSSAHVDHVTNSYELIGCLCSCQLAFLSQAEARCRGATVP
jgi:hypothetical protein